MRFAATLLLAFACAAETPDPRNVSNGFVIPDESYSDQPYVVVTNDGNWLCVLTTGKGVEGQARPAHHLGHFPGQRPHLVAAGGHRAGRWTRSILGHAA